MHKSVWWPVGIVHHLLGVYACTFFMHSCTSFDIDNLMLLAHNDHFAFLYAYTSVQHDLTKPFTLNIYA